MTPRVDRTDLNRGLAAVNALRSAAEPVSIDAGVDRLDVHATARIGDVPWPRLLAAAPAGHVLAVSVDEQDWRFDLRAEGSTRPFMSQDGAAQLVLDADQIDALAHAVDTADAAAVLGVLTAMTATIELTVRNDATRTGAHWVADVATLAAALTGPSWIAAVTALSTGPQVIVTDDATPAMTVAGFSLAGADSVPPTPPDPVAVSDAEYRAWRGESRAALPSPARFAPRPGDDQTPLREALAGVTRLLVWWWLAEEATVVGAEARLLVRGAKHVPLALTPQPADAVAADVALYLWATAVPDPALAEAVQQAASLAIDTVTDLPGAAEPILRTGRSLYDLSRRRAIAEAMAARRAARSAAVSAARDASKAARDAATKTVERVLVQVGATAGIFLARAGKLVNRGEAIALLVAVAVVTVASFAVTWWVDLASARRTLDAELRDLDQYRDSLSADDITAIRGVSVIGAATRAASHARIVSAVLYGVVLASIAIGIAVIAGQEADVDHTSSSTSAGSSDAFIDARTRGPKRSTDIRGAGGCGPCGDEATPLAHD